MKRRPLLLIVALAAVLLPTQFSSTVSSAGAQNTPTKTKLAMAGLRAPYRHSAAVRVYDTLTDEWTVLADLPDARIGPAAGAWHGRLFFTVGYSPKLDITTQSYLGEISFVA